VLLVTVAFLVPAANKAHDRLSNGRRAAGVGGWEQAPVPAGIGESGGTRFRWTHARAALREPVEGARVQIPIYLMRPEPIAEPVTVTVSVDNLASEQVTLTRTGWHIVSFDIVSVLGQGRWQSQSTVTFSIVVSPSFVPADSGSSTDRRKLGVCVGDVVWSGPPPPSKINGLRRPS
jgi:hypothetical protein